MRKSLSTFVSVALVGASLAGASAGEPNNVSLRFEWIEVPTVTFWKILHEAPPREADATGFHKRVRKLVEKGEAKIVDVARIDTRSGQRAKTENIREFLFTSDFEIPEQIGEIGDVKGGLGGLNIPVVPFNPTAFDCRNVGMTVEVDPVMSRLGDWIDLNLAPERVAFGRWHTDQRHLGFPVGNRSPVFYAARISTAVSVPGGGRVLLGANSAHDGKGNIDRSRKILSFVRGETGIDAGKAKPKSPVITTVFEWVDVELKTLSGSLLKMESERGAGVLRAKMNEMVEGGEARIREMVIVPTKGGQRAKTESISELTFAVDYSPSSRWPASVDGAPKSLAEAVKRVRESPHARAFDVRNVGTMVEVDPVLDAGEHTVSLRFAAEMVDHHGDVWHVPGSGKDGKQSGVFQPLFSV